MDFWHLNQNKNKLIKTFVESILLYVLETWTIIGEAVRWHIHKIGNKSTKHQLETTIYTGTDYFTDHCLHAKEEMISYLFSPTSEKRNKAIQLSGNTCER